MVLLLDGLDEIEDVETNEKIAGLLDEFARCHPRCKMIVTSRPIGLKREDYPLYRPLDLLPLSPAMIDDYLTRWFGDNTDSILKLQQTFNDKPRIRTLAANPFLLSMICYTFERDGKTELIERRSQLYENCTRYLLERPYDPESGHGQRIDCDQALEILKDVSQRFFLRQAANPDWEEVVRLYVGLLSRDEDVKALINRLWTINRLLALRATTEVNASAAEIIQPLIEQEQANQGKLLLVDSLEQSLPLVAEAERHSLLQKTLHIMLLECEERDCQVIYYA